MRTAFLFPGQGSQFMGMGKDLYDAYPMVRDIFSEAEDVLGINIKDIMFEGPEEKLTDTEFAQPCLLALSYAIFSVLPDQSCLYMAGHSLGEYSALLCAGALNFKDALKLVHHRGKAMKNAPEGGMAAVVGLAREDLEALLIDGCIIANDNCPGQLVISGLTEPLETVMQKAKDNGAKIVKKLNVAGPFHSPWMGDAAKELMDYLESVEIGELKCPYYPNILAKPVSEASKIKSLLIQQITGPVRFRETLLHMGPSIDLFFEIGPGKVLQGLVRRTVPDCFVASISNPKDLGGNSGGCKNCSCQKKASLTMPV